MLAEIHFDLFFVDGDLMLYLIDRASRLEAVYFLEHKNDIKLAVGAFTIPRATAAEKSIDIDRLCETLNSRGLTQSVKLFYSDNAAEHVDSELSDLLFDMLIGHNHSVVESQHQNGLAENGGGWSLMKALRHDLDLSNLSRGFRRDCIRLNVARRNCPRHYQQTGTSS